MNNVYVYPNSSIISQFGCQNFVNKATLQLENTATVKCLCPDPFEQRRPYSKMSLELIAVIMTV